MATAVRRASERMPRQLEPMKALLSVMPANEELYAFEHKWDGERAIGFWDGRHWRLQSRNLLDVTSQYPDLDLSTAIKASSAIIDGEIVAIDSDGKVSFHLLQRRMHVTNPREILRAVSQVPVCYMAFDVVYLDGRDIMHEPYTLRRRRLEGLGLNGDCWHIPPYIAGEGGPLLESARAGGMEGVVAKRLDSPYTPGLRTRDWLKIKIVHRQEFVIGGYAPMKGVSGAVPGSLLVGYYEGGKLLYAGSVGTGFDDNDRRELAGALESLRQDKSPFDGPRPRADAIYVRPVMVAEIEFRQWTPDGMLRQPSFKGVRLDKDPAEVVREVPKKV